MKQRWELAWFVVALCCVLGAGLSWMLRADVEQSIPSQLTGGLYQPDNLLVKTSPLLDWDPPGSQSGGDDWIFEVFTPPIIYFNPETRTFTVTPPFGKKEVPPFGLVVSEIKRALYRLQFAGYLGGEGKYLIEIQDIEGGTYLRGRVGEVFDDSDFEILDFSAERVLIQPEDPAQTPYVENVVHLEIRDRRLNETVVLSRAPKLSPKVVGEFVDMDGGRHTLGIGDSVQVGDAEYRIDSMDIESETASVTRRSLLDDKIRTEDLQVGPNSAFN